MRAELEHVQSVFVASRQARKEEETNSCTKSCLLCWQSQDNRGGLAEAEAERCGYTTPTAVKSRGCGVVQKLASL